MCHKISSHLTLPSLVDILGRPGHRFKSSPVNIKIVAPYPLLFHNITCKHIPTPICNVFCHVRYPSLPSVGSHYVFWGFGSFLIRDTSLRCPLVAVRRLRQLICARYVGLHGGNCRRYLTRDILLTNFLKFSCDYLMSKWFRVHITRVIIKLFVDIGCYSGVYWILL